MRIPSLTCACGEIMVKSLEDTSKIRAKVTIVKGNQVFGICKGCNKEIALPLSIDAEKVNPPIFIKK